MKDVNITNAHIYETNDGYHLLLEVFCIDNFVEILITKDELIAALKEIVKNETTS